MLPTQIRTRDYRDKLSLEPTKCVKTKAQTKYIRSLNIALPWKPSAINKDTMF